VITEATLVVSLGGDGTFLEAARLAHQFGARVLAVNLGRLGFLLNVPPSELVDDINPLARARPRRGSAGAHDHLLERLGATSSPSTRSSSSVRHAGHMVRVKTFVDADEFLTYSADGVMVAHAHREVPGTTSPPAGPVVDATLPVMIVTPIARISH